jgi:DNA-directed RNA polymerase sigma subunit (sigma70/sigma32)
VQTRTTEREGVREALSQSKLTQEEENVLRMRMGVSEPGSHSLEFRGQDHPETRAKLAMLERSLLEALRRRPDAPSPELAERKARIIRKLNEE